jgi:crotonobetainyl-CoA:carnitine CoA-transferase CaiB-like acyl-CoA transferase
LIRRDRTGEGACIDCAQFEAASTLICDKYLAQQLAPEFAGPLGNRSLDMAPHGCYPCAGDDTWCAIAVASDAQWAALAAIVGEDWASEPALATADGRLACRERVDAGLAAWTRTRPADEVEQRLRAAGVPVSKVRIGDDLAADAEKHESGFFAWLTHPTAGARAYTGLPVRDGHGRRPALRRAPLLGEHDMYVLYDILGLSTQEVSDLAAAGAIGH